MRIYQLDAASRDASTNETIIRNQQAYMLTKWLESGVFEAVERRWVAGVIHLGAFVCVCVFVCVWVLHINLVGSSL